MHRLVDPTPGDIPLVPLSPQTQDDWVGAQPEPLRHWVRSNGFEAKQGSLLPCPGTDGGLECVLLGLGPEPDLWSWATATDRLPAGSFAYDPSAPVPAGEEAALAWALAAYRFDRYRTVEDDAGERSRLAWPDGVDRPAVLRAASAVCLARDLVNTPAGDLGPGELAGAVEELAGRHAARFEVIVGDALLDAGYPAVHAVGRAASRAPRLVDLRWGDESAPRLTLVGKG
ncbi:MAG: leucyl aminopeptidase family protein, partial [Planctomycetota bacterium]